MPNKTNIEWCDYSTNPLRAETEAGKRGHACAKISPGCLHCYSDTINNRFGTGLDYTAANVRKVTHYLDEKELAKILSFRPRPPFKNSRSRPAVFPFDMTDVFGDWVSDETIDKLFATFALRPDVDFLVLTKRAERMASYIASRDKGEKIVAAQAVSGGGMRVGITQERFESLGHWYDDTLPNVWLGVSCEDQKRADERIPWLLKTPAAVKFLSCEPLLGPIELDGSAIEHGLDRCGGCETTRDGQPECSGHEYYKGLVDWIIVGGESGHGARPMQLGWAQSIVDQCKAAGIACFVKQLGSNARTWDAYADGLGGVTGGGGITRYGTASKKGGDPEEWPEDLRVRQMPEVAHG